MWLLDANMPLQILPFLKSAGIEADSTLARSWNRLSNGDLVNKAVNAGFTVLLTRDQLFAESAARALKTHSQFSVVWISLPQIRSEAYLRVFKSAWDLKPIVPIQGQATQWP
jgi:predicted nuclease of predicted toxin-antitoxin system